MEQRSVTHKTFGIERSYPASLVNMHQPMREHGWRTPLDRLPKELAAGA